LKDRWLSEAAPHLHGIRQIIAEAKPAGALSGVSASGALALGEEHVFERHSVVDEKILLREALIVGRGDIKLDQLRGALVSRLESGELVQTGRMIASRETLAMEKSVVGWAAHDRGAFPRMGKFTAQDSLSPEQNRAAEKLLASQDRVVVLIGDAGAGKSTILPIIVQGVHETGDLTFACAPSSGAVQELQDKLKIQADTVQQLLVNERLQEQVAIRQAPVLVDVCGQAVRRLDRARHPNAVRLRELILGALAGMELPCSDESSDRIDP
jgi:ATP-dependent exoDNAse (exonuclease V) alpha subunit